MPAREETSIRFVVRFVLAAYLVEAGLILIVGPWTIWWRRNFFADEWRWLGVLMENDVARGAVILLGILTFVAGVVDFRQILGFRPAGEPAPPVHVDP